MNENTEYSLSSELSFARRAFPGNTHMLAALMEEVGELAQALIDAEADWNDDDMPEVKP